MKETMKRLLTLTVAMAMLFSMLSVGVSAQSVAAEPSVQVETEPTVPVETEPAVEQTTEPVQVETLPKEEKKTQLPTKNAAVAQSQENAITLELGVWTDAVVTKGEEEICLAFTPEESGTYVFSSNASQDPVAYLMNADGNDLARDDDSGADNNFMLCYDLEAGETYYLYVYFWDGSLTGTIPVKVFLNPVAAVKVAPISIMEGTCGGVSGEYNEETGQYEREFWYYDHRQFLSYANYTVVFNDGTTVSGIGNGFEYQGEWYDFHCYYSQGYEDQWTAGNTYTVTVGALSATTEVPVTIEKAPLVSLEFAPISVMEGTCGWITSQYDQELDQEVEYWRYSRGDLMQLTTYTATFSDGTVLTGNGADGFEYQGMWFNFATSDDQSYYNQWTVGNTYAITVSVMGANVKVPVTIEKSPVEKLEFTPVSVMEGTHGGYSWMYDEETGERLKFWYYSPWDALRMSTYTVTLSDGTVISGSDTEGFEYQGTRFQFECHDYQDYYNQWTAGNTHTLKVSVMGVVAEIPVTIEKSPVVSVNLTPISIAENSCGWMDSNYNEETGEYEEYWRYHVWELLRYSTYTVTFADGTVVTGNGNSFEYQGQWHSFGYFDDQSSQNPWTVGNTYTLTVSAMGVSTEVPVTVEKSPLVSLELTPVSVMENSRGWLASEYNEETGEEEEYWRYRVWELLHYTTYTATFNDGTVLSGTDSEGFEYNGVWYSFDYLDYQNCTNKWTVGNTYTVPVSAMGVTAEMPVTIEKSPLVSLEFTPVSVMENTCGYENTWYDEQTGEYLEYWYYQPWSLLRRSTYTATFDDGTVLTGNGDGLEYQGTWYSFSVFNDQNYENQWTAGNTYTFTASMMGITAEVSVTIEKSPLVSIEFTPVSVIEGTSGYLENYYNENGEYVEYWRYYTGDLLRRSTYTATFSDGTVLTGNNTGFEYQGTWYSFEYRADQNYENQWTAGNTYPITVSAMGITAEVPVTIEKSPVVGLTVSPIVLEEHTGGYWSGYYENGQYTEYFYYYWQDRISYTITMADGSEITGNRNGFYYEGEHYSVSCSAQQGGSNPWLAGNTYPVTISVLGQIAETTVTIATAKTADGYTFIVQGDKAVITDCTLEEEVLQIPETIEGYAVVGITSLGNATYYATEIHIPDSVTMLSNGVFSNDEWFMRNSPLKKLYIGSGVSTLSVEMMYPAAQLEEVVVSADNPNYCSVDGVVYNKDCTAMIFYPFAKQTTHIIPDSVTDIDVLFDNGELYSGVNVQFGAGIKDYQIIDGITYNSDKTKIFSCSSELTGSFVMPESVVELGRFAFANSNLTEVTVSPNVTEIVYGAFSGSKLETIHIPESVTAIGLLAFDGCQNLEAVHIDDLAAWCEIEFIDNPLIIARDLYLDGKLIKDMVIPSVTEVISSGAFQNGSMTSVTIPANVKIIDSYAFAGSAVQKLELSEGLNYIGYRAFTNSAVESLDLPDSLTQLGGAAFRGCSQLKEATIGDGLTELSWGVFERTALTSVVIPKNIRYIYENAFANSKLTDVTFDCEEVYIGVSAFENCPLGDLTFGDNVKEIGDWAFAGAKAPQVILPGSVTEITYRAFAFNTNLVSVTIPESIQYIDPNAFKDDFNLSHVLYTGTQEQWENLDYKGSELMQATVHYQAVGNEVTTERTDTHIRYYCSICDKQEEIPILTGIRIAQLPEKLEYYTRQRLRTEGLSVIGIYADGSEAEITNYSISEDYLWWAGTHTIWVTYGNLSDSFTVEVRANLGVYFDWETGIEVFVPEYEGEIYVTAQQVDVENILPIVPEVLQNNPSVVYDVYVQWDSNIQPEAPITVYMPIDETMDGQKCKVYHIDDDGIATDMKAQYEAGYMVFETTHFSYYAVVEEPAVLGDFTGDGGVNNDDVVLLLWHTLFPEDYPVTASGDLNGDGSVNNDDVVLLLWHTLFPDDYPLGA